MYLIIRRPDYDFAKQSYADLYPNLHRYPATMLPQIGLKLLQEFNCGTATLYDPYCGSGSSFAAGLDYGIKTMDGYDLNPLARLISQAKFTPIEPLSLQAQFHELKAVLLAAKPKTATLLQFFNADYWFSEDTLAALALIHEQIEKIQVVAFKRLFQVAFSETLRYCSYTRNGEFKLYRMEASALAKFKPPVLTIFLEKLSTIIHSYTEFYYPKLAQSCVQILNAPSQALDHYQTILTSPPYGDSRTTVAYGQFSRFTNEWLGSPTARNLDTLMMGGKKAKTLYQDSLITNCIRAIAKTSEKRALEISSFYQDLEASIGSVAKTLKLGGLAFYVVGNRRVADIQLPTDQFIAEQFERLEFKHLATYERLIGNKVMPSENSPSNKTGEKSSTMSQEFIVVCEKQRPC